MSAPSGSPGDQADLPTALTSHHPPASRKDVNMVEFAAAARDQALYRREDIRLGEGDQRDRLWLPGLG